MSPSFRLPRNSLISPYPFPSCKVDVHRSSHCTHVCQTLSEYTAFASEYHAVRKPSNSDSYIQETSLTFVLCSRARSIADNQSQRGYESGQYQSSQYQGGGDQGGEYQSGGYRSGEYSGNGYQYGQYRAYTSGPATPPPSPRTLASIRSADQRNTAALSPQQAGLSQIQARAGQYIGSVTSNLAPQDRGTAPSSSYRYPMTITETFDQYERRQERNWSSSNSRENAGGRDSQERRQERSNSDRSSQNAHTSSDARERREKRNDLGRYE